MPDLAARVVYSPVLQGVACCAGQIPSVGAAASTTIIDHGSSAFLFCVEGLLRAVMVIGVEGLLRAVMVIGHEHQHVGCAGQCVLLAPHTVVVTTCVFRP